MEFMLADGEFSSPQRSFQIVAVERCVSLRVKRVREPPAKAGRGWKKFQHANRSSVGARRGGRDARANDAVT